MAGESSGSAHKDRTRRHRIVSRQWLRDPDGSTLPRPPPVGTRAPNGLIWGHSLEDFMWIQRIPNVNVLTIWTRSMIKEFAENYDEGEFAAPEPRPRVRRPWPVLRIAQDARNRTVPPVGAYDEGSDHEDDDDEPRAVRSWRVRADDPETGEAGPDKIINRFVVEGLSDALVPNDGEEPVISPLRHPYAALWTPEFRRGFAMARRNGTCGPFTLIRRPGSKSGHAELADETGLMAVLIHDIDEHEPPTRYDPAALVMEDGGKTLSVFHDPTPVVFLNKFMKSRGRDTEANVKTKAEAVPAETLDHGTKEAPEVAGDVDMASSSSTEDKVTHETVDPAPSEDKPMHEDAAPTSDTTQDKTTSEDVDMTSSEDKTTHEDVDMPSSEDKTTHEDPNTTCSGKTVHEDADTAPSEGKTTHDVVEMATPSATEDKIMHDETQVETRQPEDDQNRIDPGPEPGSSVDDAEQLPSSNDIISTSLTDKGTRLVMIGVLDDSDSEDECEAEDETDMGEAEKDILTKHIKEDTTFDEKVLESLPKLEEFIPEEYFPDALMVHRQGQPPRKYKRILPKLARDDDSSSHERVATLYLGGPVLGEGHHSTVRRAPLQLPSPLSAFGQHRMVTVAVKRSFATVSARKFLRHEAGIFNLFPRHLQEEYCGYNLVSPIRHPVPVGAVVPKFYGYYVPIANDGSWQDETYEGCSEDDMSQAAGTSPLLLMEECGDPVVPRKFSIDDRSECYSLVCRLHLAGFLQGSMYVRNILWQPGPLWKPPQKRSRDTPSFRIIDFGRAMYWDDHVRNVTDRAKRELKDKEWRDQAASDRQRVEKELLIQDWDY